MAVSTKFVKNETEIARDRDCRTERERQGLKDREREIPVCMAVM